MENHETKLTKKQRKICNKDDLEFEPHSHLKVGILLDVIDNIQLIPASRFQAEESTSRWFIWTGEYSEDRDFFKLIDVVHLLEWCHLILPYLGLPSGAKFSIAEDGNDVIAWKDLLLPAVIVMSQPTDMHNC